MQVVASKRRNDFYIPPPETTRDSLIYLNCECEHEVQRFIINLNRLAKIDLRTLIFTFEDNFQLAHDQFLLILGKDLENPLGYVKFYKHLPIEPEYIGEISRLTCLSGMHIDITGAEVSRSNLHTYSGYKEYTGKGAIAYIECIEVLEKNSGVGTILMNTLVSSELIEIIELDARSEEEALFFEKFGFKRLRFQELGYDPDFDTLPLVPMVLHRKMQDYSEINSLNSDIRLQE